MEQYIFPQLTSEKELYCMELGGGGVGAAAGAGVTAGACAGAAASAVLVRSHIAHDRNAASAPSWR